MFLNSNIIAAINLPSDPKKAQVLLRPNFWMEQLEHAETALLGGLAQAITIIILFLIARSIANRLIDGVVVPILTRDTGTTNKARSARIKTLQGIIKSVINYTLIFMAVVALLQGFGIGVGGIIASAGVLGLAVVLVLKSWLKM
jgi:small-conductance mechanosensitive channel